LPTIRSRLSRIHFGPLDGSIIREHLATNKKLSAEDAERIASLAEGSLARALELTPKNVERRAQIIRDFEALSPADPRTWIRFAEAYGGSREDADEVLEVLSAWTRDVAVHSVSGVPLLHPELKSLAEEVSARVRPAALHQRQRLFSEAREVIDERNASGRLQLERALILLQRPAR
jgi:DNA polymerase III subunit delta'